MKKTLALAALSLSLASCAELTGLMNNLSSGAFLQEKAPVSLSKQQFAERYVKGDMEYKIKDIKTSQGEKRYLLVLGEPFNAEIYTYVFDKVGDQWVLGANGTIAGAENSAFSGDNIEAEIISLGKEQQGFRIISSSGGSGGRSSKMGIIYDSKSEMKIIPGCFSEDWQDSYTVVKCTAKINTKSKMTEGYYPIEYHYTLTKYKPYTEGSGAEAWDKRKVLAKRTGKVLVEFNSASQSYVLPSQFQTVFMKSIQEEDTNGNKNAYSDLWNYFKK
ncbi:hypothetical protein A4G20_03620 [Pasteurellaceae bacterium RH1A]|nr:hypothetical protein A4G20_03620 [Pasteurellaceae bacterium RH1A]